MLTPPEPAALAIGQDPVPIERLRPEVVDWRPAGEEFAQNSATGLGFHIDLATDLSPAEKEKILQTLQAWAKAWETQDVGSYLAHYSTGFQPEGGQTKEAWQRGREVRLAKPSWIKIELTDLQLSSPEEGQVQVWLKQIYRSDTYGDQTIKSIDLTREAGDWKIKLERTYQEG